MSRVVFFASSIWVPSPPPHITLPQVPPRVVPEYKARRKPEYNQLWPQSKRSFLSHLTATSLDLVNSSVSHTQYCGGRNLNSIACFQGLWALPESDYPEVIAYTPYPSTILQYWVAKGKFYLWVFKYFENKKDVDANVFSCSAMHRFSPNTE